MKIPGALTSQTHHLGGNVMRIKLKLKFDLVGEKPTTKYIRYEAFPQYVYKLYFPVHA